MGPPYALVSLGALDFPYLFEEPVRVIPLTQRHAHVLSGGRLPGFIAHPAGYVQGVEFSPCIGGANAASQYKNREKAGHS